MSNLELFTDGGASPNPGKGGWAAVLLADGKKINEVSGALADTSNNRMELTAAIQGLSLIEPGQSITLHTDSNYVRQGITEWINGWKSNGWKTAAKKPVKNQDLWIALDEVVSQRQVIWRWVKGHSGHEWNDYVDELVGKARESL